MLVLGKHRNEMTAVYLAKPYCLSLSRMVVKSGILVMSDLHKVNVVWNACFRRMFCGFYRESVKPLQYFLRCSTSFLFCSSAQAFILEIFVLPENALVASLFRLTAHNFVAVGSLYGVLSRKLSVSAIKHSIWNTFTS